MTREGSEVTLVFLTQIGRRRSIAEKSNPALGLLGTIESKRKLWDARLYPVRKTHNGEIFW